MSRRRQSVLTLLIVVGLTDSSAFARSAVDTLPEAYVPVEFRQLQKFREIDQDGVAYANRLLYIFQKLRRQGHLTFSIDLKVALNEISLKQKLLLEGILFDPQMRESYQLWTQLGLKAITSDFDPNKSYEASVFSRDSLTQGLLSSPQFWQRVLDISREDNFDYRPIIRREIRSIQYFGSAIAWTAVGGGVGIGLRLLKLSRMALIAVSVPPAAITALSIWELNNSEDSAPITSAGLKNQVEQQQRETHDLQVFEEHQRRLVILKMARALKSGLAQADLPTLRKTDPELIQELTELKSKFPIYRDKLIQNRLPIRVDVDDPVIRAEVLEAVNYLINIADKL